MSKLKVTSVRIVFLALFVYLFITGKVMLWLSLFATTLIVGFFFGRIYCGYVCPMNTLMIPTEWLSKKLKLQTKKTPKWLNSGKFAWIVLFISISTMIIFNIVLNKNLPVLLILLIISVFITLRYKLEVFHNKICPYGILQKHTGRFARLSRRVQPNKCVGCKLCEKSCPSSAIKVSKENKKAMINPSLCHQCQNCSLACPKDAIYYGASSDMKLKQKKFNM
ncbi:hypothetical protein BKP37_01160 [Anaerobacillus alkalilacustris]|uniref:4Fe-4S ferredoxin-type domain-containing protein n=1 Tax=Anaerobacillus alkalilacustris TaxID=393763 RepID=A0A1S2LYA0_9BACI|nr:4Fe-4S binding protein [Anaerobacillus alkalilacustris]OIJ17173.1 hypothetical protein BKP37_01160 [Anaerobacillus alkalilacustris]